MGDIADEIEKLEVTPEQLVAYNKLLVLENGHLKSKLNLVKNGLEKIRGVDPALEWWQLVADEVLEELKKENK